MLREMSAALFVCSLFVSVSAVGEPANALQSACAEVRMDCSYNARYDLIDQVWSATSQVLFDKGSNPYTAGLSDADAVLGISAGQPPRFYIGTAAQNAKLARNIRANAALFVNGTLTPRAAARWKSVR